MRILQLSFKNLNSLAGTWQIDFTHPDFVSSGIFAITGPTGAGKTTILDAICLALYGQTPRLSKITQNDNEIISRQTGECFAEVEFETAKGRFRCHWSQHRSRKRVDGQLQAPKHEIVEAESGKIIESKLAAVAKRVEEVTGMDFDRFTRSMLLAQGGFAAFLQATPDKRAPILEQITGTAIYSQISMKVHECTSEQRKILESLRLELDGIQLLAPEEEAVLRREQAEKQRQETLFLAALSEIREAQAWKERMAFLEEELTQLEEAWRVFEGKKQAAAAELACLAQATKALTLEGEYAQLVGVRRQQEDEQAELAGVTALSPKVQVRLQAAGEVLTLADLALKKAADEQQREAELIRTTRALDTTIAEVLSQVKGHQADAEAGKKQCLAYRASLAHVDEEIALHAELRRAVDAFLNEHRADAALAGSLAGIEQQLKALKLLAGRAADSRAELERHVAQNTILEQSLRQAENDWQGALQAVAEAEQRVGAIRAAGVALLQGRELSSWREEAEKLSSRQNRLLGLADVLARVGDAGQRLQVFQEKITGLEKKRSDMIAQEADLARECGLREQLTRQLQDSLVLLNRVRDLEAERARLIDGAPCPLCGATEHPYAAGNVPHPDTARQELEQAGQAYKKSCEQLSRVRADLAAVVKEIEQAGLQRAECRERLAIDEAYCASGLAELSLAAAAAQRQELILAELDSCRRELENCRSVIREAEVREQELSTASAALDKAKEALNYHDKARQAAELGKHAAESAVERLTRENETLRGELDRASAEAEQALAAYGYGAITPETVDGIFAALTARHTAYLLQQQEIERLEKTLAELASKKGQLQALLAAAETTLATTGQRLAASLQQRDTLAGQRREMFGERNPDSEERRLAAALAQAAVRREEALRSRDALQHESAGLEQRLLKLTGTLAARAAQLHPLESALQRSLRDAGFSDESAFLQARLPQARLEELSRLAEELQRNEVEIQTRRRDRSAALRQERDKNLSEKTLGQIREEQAAGTAQLHELQKNLGAIAQRLQQHAGEQQRQRERLQALELQKKECARWERLHALIGSSDGKKFRNFAQGLTFELMVGHANRQLRKMSDRYILVRDHEEPLELNVLDNYQAGEVRSTRNLSGGESFIASLALSLGLSGMASRNVRVDSLFLDEGFGTLDEDALETALETLAGLQQDGKLIGIISHVPALKERIGTQIQVESGSAGRSSLRGPGCRRIS
ncbi:MAG: chromosome segregation protein SMC [Deltaproteobacteria bacterium]|nr:chromosome segregation protein SMC [Deltaproteobacteria bacterium]TLN03459.1 MAG: chromosome segregation protein SMC [bacterium]